MGWNDSQEMQDLINQQQQQATQALSNNANQLQNQYNTMWGNYNTAVPMGWQGYGNVMNAYQQFLSGGNPSFGPPTSSGMGNVPQITATTPMPRYMGNVAGGTGPGGMYNTSGMTGGYNPSVGATGTLNTGMTDAGGSFAGAPPPGNIGMGTGAGTGMMRTMSGGMRPNPNAPSSGGPAGATQAGPTSSTGAPYAMQASGSTNTQDIINQLTPFYQSLGATPTGRGTGATDIAYYADQIAATGGLTQGNIGYWTNRIQSDMKGGGQAGGGGGGGGNTGSAIGGYQDFAQTGGFTPQNIQDFRARAIAPIRAAYQQAQDNLAQQQGLSGGYSPNAAAAGADMARQQSYAMSDAETNANAAIAQMVQQGRLAGLGGLTNAQLGALSGMTGMYGATPGLAGMYGNQALGTSQQQLGNVEATNQLANILFNAKNMQSQIPSNFQQAMGDVSSVVGLGGDIMSGYTQYKNLPGLSGSSGGYGPTF